MIEIVPNQQIKEQIINDVPTFYRSMGGNPYQTRLDDAIDVGKQMFKAERIITIPYERKADHVGPDEITYYHGLGFRPFVTGSYIIHSSTVSAGLEFPDELRGTIPELRWPWYGASIEHSTRIVTVDKNKVVVQLNLDVETAIIDVKLNIFREPTSNVSNN